MSAANSSSPVWASSETQVLRELQVDARVGLSESEAHDRVTKNGQNVILTEAGPSNFRRFFDQFRSPVILTLIAASVLSAILGDSIDALAIISIVLLNGVMGFLQESRAEKAAEALTKLTAPIARVLREGEIREIATRDLTRGDILVLEAGDFIGADSKILVANQFSVDESILTGESLPVSKTLGVLPSETPLADRTNMLWGGTVVTTGSARAVVTATGIKSAFGEVARLLSTAKKSATPLQRRLKEVTSRLLILCAALVGCIAALGFFRGDPWLQILMSSIGLAVAAIPEGLPAVVTLAMALAVRRMAKRKAIVRHLPAVETLGSTDVICTDKTGTLTTGKMHVREVIDALGASHSSEDSVLLSRADLNQLIKAGVLCSNADLGKDDVGVGDTTEVALLKLAATHSPEFRNWKNETPRLKEWSFDSTRKRMSVAVERDQVIEILVKGAPESILPLCLESDKRAILLAEMDTLSGKGRRLLAIASRTWVKSESLPEESSGVEAKLNLLGVVAMADPPRAESKAAIQKCVAAGIHLVMITGDHASTASAIANELGILDKTKPLEVVNGAELDKISDDELVKRVSQIGVYARVTPEHKLRIVRAWKSRGKIVAMTGDGVNDAPALKEASIGISMGKGGTEVARQASSLILADDNFATIVSAVEEGRAIYGNIRRTIIYLLSGNLAEILVMLGAAFAGWPTPLMPIHLLWINLVTDGLPALALAAEPVPANALSSESRPNPNSFFDRRLYTETISIGLITSVLALGVYFYTLRTDGELMARTHIFSFLVFAELFRSFASRSETRTYWQMGPKTNLLHLLAAILPLLFQLLLHHTEGLRKVFKVATISWTECIILLAIALLPVTLLELRKIYRQFRSPKEAPA